MAWPAIVEAALAIVVLDLAIYGQHVLFHAVPLLFRFHRVHHADVDFDVTLGSRFHPVEMLLHNPRMGQVRDDAIFETLLAVTSLFNHANVRLPDSADRVLRRFVVTPAMHSIHHSAEPSDRDTNFGFSIPWWDHLFGTFREHSRAACPRVGVAELQLQTKQTLRWMISLPFWR